MPSDCESRGGCVYVKVRPEDTVRHCKDCGRSEPDKVLNEGDEGKAN